jgi:hypothetical protein
MQNFGVKTLQRASAWKTEKGMEINIKLFFKKLSCGYLW